MTRDLPILMSGPLVRAVLDGRKTETRRPLPVVYNAPPDLIARWHPPGTWNHPMQARVQEWGAGWRGTYPSIVKCPFGKPGDRLYCRESARVIAINKHRATVQLRYEVDGYEAEVTLPDRIKPPTVGHCLANGAYKEACRLWLRVLDVRPERLRGIDQQGAIAEGCDWAAPHWPNPRDVPDRDEPNDGPGTTPERGFACDNFRRLWDSIYGTNPALSWAANPWVWRVRFERIEEVPRG